MAMRPQLYDLFGEIPVTVHDLRAWLIVVPRIDPDSRRAAAYLRDWNVADKIRAAKARGDFDQVEAQARTAGPLVLRVW